MSSADNPRRYEGTHATLQILRPRPGVIVVILEGSDVGEVGDAPFRLLDRYVAGDMPTELFIDARHGRGASVEVGTTWAMWLRRHRSSLQRVAMLTRTRVLRLSADLIQRFSGLGDAMEVYEDPEQFDAQLDMSMRWRG